MLDFQTHGFSLPTSEIITPSMDATDDWSWSITLPDPTLGVRHSWPMIDSSANSSCELADTVMLDLDSTSDSGFSKLLSAVQPASLSLSTNEALSLPPMHSTYESSFLAKSCPSGTYLACGVGCLPLPPDPIVEVTQTVDEVLKAAREAEGIKLHETDLSPSARQYL